MDTMVMLRLAILYPAMFRNQSCNQGICNQDIQAMPSLDISSLDMPSLVTNLVMLNQE